MLSELSHQFYLRWSFYCCMIVRDLTLRSANSFGTRSHFWPAHSVTSCSQIAHVHVPL